MVELRECDQGSLVGSAIEIGYMLQRRLAPAREQLAGHGQHVQLVAQ